VPRKLAKYFYFSTKKQLKPKFEPPNRKNISDDDAAAADVI